MIKQSNCDRVLTFVKIKCCFFYFRDLTVLCKVKKFSKQEGRQCPLWRWLWCHSNWQEAVSGGSEEIKKYLLFTGPNSKTINFSQILSVADLSRPINLYPLSKIELIAWWFFNKGRDQNVNLEPWHWNNIALREELVRSIS